MIPRGLYGIADAAFGDPVRQGRILVEEGVQVVQLRCKGWTDDALRRAGEDLLRVAPILLVNDRVAVARALGCGVHLGQDDGPDPDIPFGRSTHTLAQAVAAGPAAYLGFGPIYATSTKDTGYGPRGIDLLRAVVGAVGVPVVAIGGIDVQHLEEVKGTGVHAWAVLGALWRSPDPRAVIRALR